MKSIEPLPPSCTKHPLNFRFIYPEKCSTRTSSRPDHRGATPQVPCGPELNTEPPYLWPSDWQAQTPNNGALNNSVPLGGHRTPAHPIGGRTLGRFMCLTYKNGPQPQRLSSPSQTVANRVLDTFCSDSYVSLQSATTSGQVQRRCRSWMRLTCRFLRFDHG